MSINNILALLIPVIGFGLMIAFLHWDTRRSERKRLHPGE